MKEALYYMQEISLYIYNEPWQMMKDKDVIPR